MEATTVGSVASPASGGATHTHTHTHTCGTQVVLSYDVSRLYAPPHTHTQTKHRQAQHRQAQITAAAHSAREHAHTHPHATTNPLSPPSFPAPAPRCDPTSPRRIKFRSNASKMSVQLFVFGFSASLYFLPASTMLLQIVKCSISTAPRLSSPSPSTLSSPFTLSGYYTPIYRFANDTALLYYCCRAASVLPWLATQAEISPINQATTQAAQPMPITAPHLDRVPQSLLKF